MTANTFTFNIAAGCTDPSISGTYTVTNESGKNYLNVTFIGGTQKMLVNKADCNSFTTSDSDTSGSVTTVTNETFTKQ